MKLTEILKLVGLNLSQNKSKVILTSTGILVGSATIMLVIAIGTGGKLEVAEQFKNLNAGAIDISYEYQETGRSFGGGRGGGMEQGGAMDGGSMGGNAIGGGMSRGNMPGGGGMPDMGGGGMPDGQDMTGGFGAAQNTEKIILSTEEADALLEGVEGLSDATISYTTKSDVEGGDLEEAVSYTIAGVKENYAQMSNLTLAIGDFITEENDTYKEKTCVLGYSVAKEIFGSALDAYDESVYIDNRPYVVNGVFAEVGTVASGISPDEAIFIPYETGIKYLTGKNNVSPTITLIAENVNEVETAKEQAQTVLAQIYPNASFTVTDAGSKMEAASRSNETLTMLLAAMAVIVFIVGGIGIMNVLFVSVRERTNEIGILKAIGCSQKDILLEFLLEAACISLIGAILGVLLSLAVTPVIEQLSVRVELSVWGGMLSLVFGCVTGTVFGFYPAWKASKLVPVAALNHE
ncbi:MAG: ABC transporter permease [Eubacteriales bacterium]|nr:ABC transporter permease [Eubacteriales bacterium]